MSGVEGVHVENEGDDSSKGEEVEEAKAGERARDEVRDRFPEYKKGSRRPEEERKAEKQRNGGMLGDPPPGVGQETEEDENPKNNPGEGEFCSATFVAGCESQSSHVAQDAEGHEGKNEKRAEWSVDGVCHGRDDCGAISQEIEKAPADSHGNDCEESPLVQ